jgi:hypothetical protein
MQSSVLACWLDFGQAGLASLPTSAFVAHPTTEVQLDNPLPANSAKMAIPQTI